MTDDDVERIRDRSRRLFALAFRAQDGGQTVLAEELTKLAIEAEDHARSVEEKSLESTAGVRPVSAIQVQQQPQVQPRPQKED